MTPIQLPGLAIPISISSILWLESESNYTRIYYQDGSNTIVTKPINYFVQYAGFVRVHRSILANFMYIQGLVNDTNRSIYLELVNGKRLPVSRSYQPLMTSLFGSGGFNRQLDTSPLGVQPVEQVASAALRLAA